MEQTSSVPVPRALINRRAAVLAECVEAVKSLFGVNRLNDAMISCANGMFKSVVWKK